MPKSTTKDHILSFIAAHTRGAGNLYFTTSCIPTIFTKSALSVLYLASRGSRLHDDGEDDGEDR